MVAAILVTRPGQRWQKWHRTSPRAPSVPCEAVAMGPQEGAGVVQGARSVPVPSRSPAPVPPPGHGSVPGTSLSLLPGTF